MKTTVLSMLIVLISAFSAPAADVREMPYRYEPAGAGAMARDTFVACEDCPPLEGVKLRPRFTLALRAGEVEEAGEALPAEDTGPDAGDLLREAFPNLIFESVRPTEIEGLYEVVAGDNIFYFHPETGHLIFGEIWTKDGRSFTAERREELVAGKIANLPLDRAVKIGDGQNTVIEISVPDCPYCRRAADFFRERADVTRYVFFFPLTQIHPEAEKKAMYILCSDTPVEAYEEVYQGKFDGKDISLPSECSGREILDEHIRIAQSLGVRGTPVFWINGKRISGADIPRIEKILGKGGERSEGNE
jgi:thiol:disulfide interchange protein DsbC